MNKIDPKRAVIFVGVFTLLAVFLSSLSNPRLVEQPVQQPVVQQPSVRQSQPAPQRFETDTQPRAQRDAQERQARQSEQEIAAHEAAERVRRAAEERAAEHARYLARYLNSNVTRKPETKTVALVVVSENGKFNRVLSAAVADRLKADSVQILPSFFKSEFVSDGLFNSAFAEPTEIFKKLELAKSLDAVLLARQKVQYSSNPSLENVITASMELELTAFPLDASAEPRTWTFRAPGPGFKQGDARAMAEERIIKQIVSDTKMSLATLFTN